MSEFLLHFSSLVPLLWGPTTSKFPDKIGTPEERWKISESKRISTSESSVITRSTFLQIFRVKPLEIASSIAD